MRDRWGVPLVLAVGIVTVLAACTSGPAAATHSSSPAVRPTPTVATKPTTSTTAHAPATRRHLDAAHGLTGVLRSVRIPAVRSTFGARKAELYLPPILRTAPTTRLPVLELLHGTPGSPTSWVTEGDIRATMDAFATAHGGRSPIVVMPDINGTERGDSECVRTPDGADVETYLTRDVPHWVSTHYRTLPAPSGWALAGLSEGGTCASMLALRHPTGYGTAVDLSGLARPTVGNTDDRAATIAQLFGGSATAYDQHDPLYLLAHHRYPTLGLWLVCGAADRNTLPSQHRVAAAATKAGVQLVQRIVPGGHSWKVWAPALRAALPWMWARMT